jgi:hypothetical protein
MVKGRVRGWLRRKAARIRNPGQHKIVAPQNINSPPPQSASDSSSEAAEPGLLILVEFLPTPNGQRPAAPGGVIRGGPMMYDPNAGDGRFAFIQNARRQGVNRMFEITGMTNGVPIQVYVVWNQGSKEVLSPVRSDAEFNRCVELMSRRGWRDRFQFVYADGSGNLAGTYNGADTGNVTSTSVLVNGNREVPRL